jgi:hypothetical protein
MPCCGRTPRLCDSLQPRNALESPMGDCARDTFTYISIGFQANLIYDRMEGKPQDIVNLRGDRTL